jgi:hypothetical protein
VRELVLNNFWWKVTALLLAVLVWFGFRPHEKRWNLFPDTFRPYYTRYFIAHPVSISKPAADTREFKVTPSEVDITLTGDEKTLRALRGSQLRATADVGDLDATDLKAKTNVLTIKISFPNDEKIKIERVNPDQVQVELLKE